MKTIKESFTRKTTKTGNSNLVHKSNENVVDDSVWFEKLKVLIEKYGGTINNAGEKKEDEKGEELFFVLPLNAYKNRKGSVEEIEWDIFSKLNPPTYTISGNYGDITLYLYYVDCCYNYGDNLNLEFAFCTEKDFGNQYVHTWKELEEEFPSCHITPKEIYAFFKRYVDFVKPFKNVSESFTKRISKTSSKKLSNDFDFQTKFEMYKEVLKKQDIWKLLQNAFKERWREVDWDAPPTECGDWFPLNVDETKGWKNLFEETHAGTHLQFAYEPDWNDIWEKELEQKPDMGYFDVTVDPVLENVYILEYYRINEYGDCDNDDFSFFDLDKDEQVEFYLLVKQNFGMNVFEEPFGVKILTESLETKSVKIENEKKPKKEHIFWENRNSYNQEILEPGEYGPNVYLKDCPFLIDKEQSKFFKIVQNAMEDNTIRSVSDYEKKCENNESVSNKNLKHLNESKELNDYGQINYSWDFDEDEYQEYLQDEETDDSQEIRNFYIENNVQFEVEFLDNETFHTVETDYYDYNDLKNEFGEKIARKILKDCIDKGEGSIEIGCLYDDEELDLSNPDEVNARAIKVLSYGRFYDGCRGFILTNGTVVYTPAEHNQCTAIDGVKGTFDFIRMGNIRILDHSIDIAKYPSKEQFNVLQKVIRTYSPLYMDLIGNGETSKTYEKPNCEQVFNDIRRFFGVKESFTRKTTKKTLNDISRNADEKVVDYENLIKDAIKNQNIKNVEEYDGDLTYIYFKQDAEDPMFIFQKDMEFSVDFGRREIIKLPAAPFRLNYNPMQDILRIEFYPVDEDALNNDWDEEIRDFSELNPKQQRLILQNLEFTDRMISESFTNKISKKTSLDLQKNAENVFDFRQIIIDRFKNGEIVDCDGSFDTMFRIGLKKPNVDGEYLKPWIDRPLFIIKDLNFMIDGDHEEIFDGAPYELEMFFDENENVSEIYVDFAPIDNEKIDEDNWEQCMVEFNELPKEYQYIIFNNIKFKK